jgi:hypothetical protein
LSGFDGFFHSKQVEVKKMKDDYSLLEGVVFLLVNNTNKGRKLGPARGDNLARNIFILIH